MTDDLVSVITPARNERFLVNTVKDLLAKARGPIEIIAVLDGYWPQERLPDDSRVRVLHFGTAQGMRPAINAAVQIARGQYLLKCDAHTMWAEGYDLQLKADYAEDNWILIPRRCALDPENWTIDQSNPKYPIDYHYLSEPFHKYGDSVPGLHGTAWTQRRKARQAITLDEEMASQGSGWFMARAHWDRLGALDSAAYGCFWFENQELSLKTWMMGGAQMVTKRTWYAHLYKGARYGRGYSTRDMGHEAANAYNSWFWLTDQPFKGRTRTMRWLIERFAPVPTWTDLEGIFKRAHEELRNPYQVAA